MKILHTADWHLGAPLQGHGEQLRQALAAVPGQILVPAATYTQDPATGAYTVTPGIATLVVSGTI